MTKIVLVTGASRGIGEVTAQLFADRGWQVAATARNRESLGTWTQAPNVAAIRLDVTDSESIRLAVEETERRFGSVDVLVNNAGVGLGGAVESVTRDELTKLFDLNLFGLIATTQAVLPSMRKRLSGVIVNVSSAAGRIGLPFLAPYCASKYAVEGLTEAMSYELAPFGIQAKLVEPGGVKTSFTQTWADSSAYDPVAAMVHDRYTIGGQKAAGPEGVAEAIFRAATDGQPRLRYAANGAGAFLSLNRWLPESAWRGLIKSAFFKRARQHPV
jgi:NAD(P)-dependent dehydrogenase (short-subunit alcohol dehydrogenase family)